MLAVRVAFGILAFLVIWIGSAQLGTFVLGSNLGLLCAIGGMFLGIRTLFKIVGP